MLMMIDNYDSFTYNLVQYFGELGQAVRVFRNDEITLEGIAGMDPDYLVLSPGPCTPAEAGVCVTAIQRFAGKIPILGICLGHQSIGAAFGARIISAKRQMHGKISTITCDQLGVYVGIPKTLDVVRYHSLAIERQSLSPEFDIASYSDDGDIMGVRHRGLAQTSTPLEGLQFHPESILTEHGHLMLGNFLRAGSKSTS
jgi:anthranilate synthase component 2